MIRLHSLVVVSALAAFAAGCATTVDTPVATEPTDPALAAVAWLEGVSGSTNDRGVRTEEYWTPPRAGTMFGINRVIAGGKTVFFENLRIEVGDDGELVYLASPKGRLPPTRFRLKHASEDEVLFENPLHDYPQRIGYQRLSKTAITMRIEGREDDQAKSAQWDMERD